MPPPRLRVRLRRRPRSFHPRLMRSCHRSQCPDRFASCKLRQDRMSRLFVSDVHLDANSSEAVEQFLSFLETHAVSAEALYILGDLHLFFRRHLQQRSPYGWCSCCSLKRGKRAFWARWINDPLLCLYIYTKYRAYFFFLYLLIATVLHVPQNHTRAHTHTHPPGCAHTFAHAHTLHACTHTHPVGVCNRQAGSSTDERALLPTAWLLCIDDHSYQELRSVVRTAPWQRKFLTLPLVDRELLADQARAGSRQHTSRTIPKIMDVNPHAVEKAYQATGVRRMIHGHTHRPDIHNTTVDGAPAQRIVLGAWYEQGSYLFYERGHYELRELPRAQNDRSGGESLATVA